MRATPAMSDSSQIPNPESRIPGTAFIFPGQGSQSIGMLAELAELHPGVRETFAEASDGAGVDLWALSQDGPEQMLNRTEYTQPALARRWCRGVARCGRRTVAQCRRGSPGTASASTPRWSRPARSRCTTPRISCASAARRCRKRRLKVSARWRPCSARTMRWSRKSVAKFRATTSSLRRTTTRPGRS